MLGKCNLCARSKHREEREKQSLLKRLKIIEGQVGGVAKMVERDQYCSDVLVQLLAVNKSIKALSQEILRSHLSGCVVKEIKANNLEVIDELMTLIARLG